MTAYKEVFANLSCAALIPFFVIGDPDFDTSLELAKAAIDAGADILELGIPFSDPIADGPTIQKADIRALDSGMTPHRSLEFIKALTDYKPIPIGLLVYYNLIYQYPTQQFFTDFKAAGGSSVLVADLSIDDVEEVAAPAADAGLDTVFMVTPNTDHDRAELIASKTTGFIYAVSTLGVTGQRSTLSDMVAPLVTGLKSITDIPICVGFGISEPEHAVQVASAGADGVIIGSKIVKFIEDNLNNKDKMKAEISAFIAEVSNALKSA